MKPQPKASDLLKKVTESFFPENEDIESQDLLIKIHEYLIYSKQIKEPRNVLDHGFVRLVDYMGNDLSIVRAARVSYDADWRTGENEKSDEKLIKYLLRNHHSSPLESVLFTFEIKCPIFVLRQWGRHRTQAYNDGAGIGYEQFWSYNEVSARYTELPEEFYVPDPSKITTQSKDNKQARTEIAHVDGPYFNTYMRKISESSFAQYKEFLDMGCPRELARTILPVSTYTRLFATVNLHNLLLWLGLRLHPHAQYEIRVYAEAMADIITHIVPVTMDAWADMRLQQNG